MSARGAPSLAWIDNPWAGIGAVGVTIAGVVLFGDALTPLRMTFIALIVVGLVGLRFVEQ